MHRKGDDEMTNVDKILQDLRANPPIEIDLLATPYRDTHTCLLCDNHTHDRICPDHNEDVPTCPCGNELTGLGSYCSSHCAEVYGRRARIRVEVAELEPTTAAAVMAEAPDAAEDDVPILLPPTSTVTPAQKLKVLLDKDVAEEATKKPKKSRRTVCTFCTNSTKGKCRCGRPLCGPCADDETGLCPHCADDAA